MAIRAVLALALTGIVAFAPGLAGAHHSYAMFDRNKRTTVRGTVAKLEWQDPHVFVWVYSPKPQGGHTLYAFETGPINMMARLGWTSKTFKPGEMVTVDFYGLKDGRPGGAFIRAIHADGAVTPGDPLGRPQKAQPPRAPKP